MWLSEIMAKSQSSDKAEKGIVTLSSGGDLEIDSSVNSRSVNSYSPYGYTCATPVGEEVIVIPSSDGQATLGVKSDCSSLESGEVRIMSKGGACIILKNDGSVIINSLVIDKNGVIKN
jgi:hypothetical protein